MNAKMTTRCLLLAAVLLLCFTAGAMGKIEWEVVKESILDEAPIDMALSGDGKTAYLLTAKSILFYSTSSGTVTDTIPLKETYSSIAIGLEGDHAILTAQGGKKISIIRISEIFDIPIGTSPVIGKKDAKVTLTVFLDYQCPYCSQIFPVIEQLLEKHPDDLNIVIKHFPLRSHKFARTASIWALAAAKQGKYIELTREMLKNYHNLSDVTIINEHAKTAGLDLEAFGIERQNNVHDIQIEEDMQLGSKLKLLGVPALFINGRNIKSRSLQDMSKMVLELAAKE
jgi:protein-disulfide isomerase